jgi:cytochrome P450 family 109
MSNPAEINVLYNKDFMNDPFPFFREGLLNAPIVRNETTLTKPWNVFRYDDVQRVLKDYEYFSAEIPDEDGSEQDMALGEAVNNLITMDPPRHTKLRRLAQPGFLPGVLKQFVPQAEKLARERVDFALAQGEFDLVHDFSAQITIGMITAILGLPAEDWPMIRDWTVEIANNVMANNWVYEYEKDRADVTVKVVGELATYFEDYISSRKVNPKDGDLVSIMLSSEFEGYTFSEREVVSTAMLLLLAGNDTTTHMISNFVTLMAQHPEQADQVRNDLSLVPSAIEETLRFAPSLMCMERVVVKPEVLHGVELTPGDIIIPWMAAANRDPEKFERPDEFDIHRKPNRHIAFGFGPHTCLGAPLARLEGKIALEEIMKRSKSFELIGDPVRPKNAIVHGPSKQQIRIEPA